MKEYNNTNNMSGKIWLVRVLSGKIQVDDKISICGTILKGSVQQWRANAVVKEIRRDNVTVDMANPGDFVTLNLKQCQIDGRRIPKSEILSQKTSLGIGYDVECNNISQIKIHFVDDDSFYDRLENSLNRLQKKRGLLRATGYQVSLLWFGQSTVAHAVSVDLLPDFSYVVTFRLHNDHYLPIPNSNELRKYVTKIIVKDRIVFKPGYRWDYHAGEITVE